MGTVEQTTSKLSVIKRLLPATSLRNRTYFITMFSCLAMILLASWHVTTHTQFHVDEHRGSVVTDITSNFRRHLLNQPLGSSLDPVLNNVIDHKRVLNAVLFYTGRDYEYISGDRALLPLAKETATHTGIFSLNDSSNALYYAEQITTNAHFQSNYGQLKPIYILIKLDEETITPISDYHVLKEVTILILAILAIHIAIFYMRDHYVLQPLKRINNAMRRRLEGDVDAYAPEDSMDEIREVATTVNKALQAASQLGSRMDVILQTAADGIITTSPTGAIESFNPAAEAIFGYKASEVIGLSVEDLMPSIYSYNAFDIDDLLDADPEELAELAAKSDSGNNTNRESKAYHCDGTEIDIDLTISEAAIGEHHLFTIFIRDVTEKKEAQRALKKSEQQFKDYSEVSSDWQWETDKDHRYTYFSERLGSLFNVDVQHLIGQTRQALMNPDITDGYQQHLDDLDNHRPFKNFIYPFNLKSRLGFVSVSGKPYFDENGEFAGYRGTGTDITEKVRMENELTQYKQHLEELVEARTTAMEEALIHAELANKAKSEFLANMSHELRTPMHAIISFSNMGIGKAETATTDKISRYFNRIHDSGNRLLSLLNDLLDLSKLEAGRMELNIHRLNFQNIIKTILEETASLVYDKKITINIKHRADDLELEADELRLQQVLRNLLSNAIKFTPEGKQITITTLATHSSEGEPLFVLEVSDQGIGIPDGEIEQVFEKFIQSSATKSGAGGTGLGLPICREIVELHHGRVEARNNEHGGATFRLYLPRKQPAESIPQVA